MRKSLLKSIVATAVVGATMALTSVAAMAATYNFADSSLTAYEYNTKNPTGLLTETTSDFDGALTINGTPNNDKGKTTNYGPVLVSYDNVEQLEKNYLTVAPTEGTLAGTRLSKAIITTAGASAKRDISLIDVPGIKNGDKIEVYYFGADSKGATGKAATIELDLDDVVLGEDSTESGKPSSNTAKYYTVDATADGTLKIYGTDGRIGIAAIVITSSDSSDEEETFVAGTTDTEVAAAKVGDDFYAILPISEAKAEEATSLTLGGVETDAIYTSVNVLADKTAADFGTGAKYVYAVKINATSGTPTLAAIQEKVTPVWG